MTEASLKKLLAKWKHRLRINDWTIKVRLATEQDSTDPDRDWYAQCHTTPTRKYAEIEFVHPRYFTEEEVKADEEPFWRDPEVNMVHELLHLHTSPFKTEPGSALEDVEETIVHIMATLLVALDRGDESLLGLKEPLPKVAAIIRKQIAAKKK